MKNTSTRIATENRIEKDSEKILMLKMGITRKEVRTVIEQYGVSPAKLLELMVLSKYQFVYNGKPEGQCEPCRHINLPVLRFSA